MTAGNAPITATPTLQVSLPTIHCAACIGKIERGLRALTGIQDARVNLSLKRLSIIGQPDPDTVLYTLQTLGFEAHVLDENALGQSTDSVANGLLRRVAVAGFAMMNVMLLSVAIWSGAANATRDLFHLLSAAIALPVVIYSAQPFFHHAWSALKVRKLNMDVPISLAIILATVMSLYETLNGGTHAYFDAAISLTFFLLIGRYLDHQTRSAARSAAKELNALEAHTAQRVRDGRIETIPVSHLAIGDTIHIPTGARLPVDGILASASASLDRSFLTGETAPITATSGDVLHTGEINLSAPFEITATAVGQDTSLRRLANLVETAENGRNRYTSLADKAAQIYAPLVHLLAATAFIGWAFATGDIHKAINVAIAVLIITCPCALGLAVPAVTTAAISRLFRAGFLVKHATALERLADVDHVVFDKTGTLTTPTVAVPDTFNDVEKSVALALAQSSLHPVSRALAAQLKSTIPAPLQNIVEIANKGITATWQGQTVRLGQGGWLGASFSGLALSIGAQEPIPFPTQHTLRQGVKSAIADINLPCEIVTGDATEPSQTLAQEIGLPVTPNTAPIGKLARLETLKQGGHKVLMIGDGLNDTAAMAAAHASLSPSSALDATRNASDVIILNETFDKIPLMLTIAKASKNISLQNFAIAAAYNCIAVPIALAGFATPLAAALAMSASSLTVLANAQRIRWIQ